MPPASDVVGQRYPVSDGLDELLLADWLRQLSLVAGAPRALGVRLVNQPLWTRHNVNRTRLIAQGRGAADVVISTAFGPNALSSFKVWTEGVVEK